MSLGSGGANDDLSGLEGSRDVGLFMGVDEGVLRAGRGQGAAGRVVSEGFRDSAVAVVKARGKALDDGAHLFTDLDVPLLFLLEGLNNVGGHDRDVSVGGGVGLGLLDLLDLVDGGVLLGSGHFCF